MPPGVLVRTPQGDTTEIPAEKLTFWLDRGYTPLSEDEYHQSIADAAAKPEATLGGAVAAGLTSAGAGATLGLSDVLLRGLATKGQLDYVAQQRAAHPYLSTVSNVAGAILPAAFSGGASTEASAAELGAEATGQGLGGLASAMPAARATELASGIGDAIRGEGGLVRSALGSSAEGATLGALQSAGNYVSDVALGNRDASAEEFLSEVGNGAKWGGIAGGALTVVEHGGIAAKRLFARSEAGTKSVAELAQRDAAGKVGSVVDAGDEAVEASRAYAAKIRGDAARQSLGAEDAVGAMRGDQAVQQLHTASAIDAAGAADLGAHTPGIVDTLARDGAQADVAATAAHDAALAHTDATAAAAEQRATQVEQLAADVERRGAQVRELMADEGHAAVLEHAPEGHAAPEAPPTTLEEMLARTKGRLDAGEDLGDVSGAARREAPVGKLASAGAPLTEKLTGTLDRIDAGETLGEIGDSAPATRDYVTSKRLENGTYEDTSQAAADGRLLQDDRFAPGSRGRGAATLGELAGHGGQVADAAGEAVRQGRYQQMLRAGKIAPPTDEVMKPGGFRPWNEPGPWWPAAQQPFAHEIAKTVDVVGGYEKSLADLNRLLGVNAPPQVAAIGAAYDAAITEAESKGARAAAAAIDDSHATPTGLTAEEHASKLEDLRAEADRRAGMADLPKRTKAMDAGVETERGAVHDPAAPGRRRPSVEAEQTIALSDHAGEAELDNPRAGTPTATHDPAAAGRRLPAAQGERALELSTHDGVGELDNPMREGQVPAPKAGKAGAAPKGAFAKLSDVGKLLEGARALGIPGVPAIAHIPVVGPLLSLVLKAKIMKSLLGRGGGMLPETVEARVAAHAASARDKMNGLIDAAIKGTAASKGAAARIAPAAADVLAHRAFDGTTPNAKSDADVRKLAAERAEQLAASTASPEAIAQAMRELVPTSDPDLGDSLVAVVQRKLEYQAAHAPPIPPPDPFGRRPPPISTAAAMKFAGIMRASEHPLSILEDLRDGTLTRAAVDAVSTIYPNLYSKIQQRALATAADLGTEVPYRTRVRLSILFGGDLDPSITNLPALQRSAPPAADPSAAPQGAPASSPPPGMPPAPSVAGTPNLVSLYQTSADRRATH